VGLLGLVASFHGILLAAGRATFELGRAGFAPRWLGFVHAGSGTPRAALVANMVLGTIAIWSGHTAEIITLSCFGALALYALSMLALLRLRVREPSLVRPFRVPGYPFLPLVALVLSASSGLALTWYNLRIAGVFLLMIAMGVIYYWLAVRSKTLRIDPTA
jgi:ethanolamine permease